MGFHFPLVGGFVAGDVVLWVVVAANLGDGS
jgi:hypothetical protein